MKNRLHILFLPVLFLLSMQTAHAASLSANGGAEIQPVEEQRSAPVAPQSQGILGAKPHSGESGENQVVGLRTLNSESSEHDTFSANQEAESVRQQWVSIYLLYSHTIEASFSLKKRLFPFHSHL